MDHVAKCGKPGNTSLFFLWPQARHPNIQTDGSSEICYGYLWVLNDNPTRCICKCIIKLQGNIQSGFSGYSDHVQYNALLGYFSWYWITLSCNDSLVWSQQYEGFSSTWICYNILRLTCFYPLGDPPNLVWKRHPTSYGWWSLPLNAIKSIYWSYWQSEFGTIWKSAHATFDLCGRIMGCTTSTSTSTAMPDMHRGSDMEPDMQVMAEWWIQDVLGKTAKPGEALDNFCEFLVKDHHRPVLLTMDTGGSSTEKGAWACKDMSAGPPHANGLGSCCYPLVN